VEDVGRDDLGVESDVVVGAGPVVAGAGEEVVDDEGLSPLQTQGVQVGVMVPAWAARGSTLTATRMVSSKPAPSGVDPAVFE